jgi:hypothetical protein
MTKFRVSNRKINADAIDWKWPGTIVTCRRDGIDTMVEWHDDSSVSIKSVEEVMTAQDEYDAAQPMAALRADRNVLLASSDWTQGNDSPLDDEAKTSWAEYRQLLRDLPATEADPANPTWPSAPE